jgi:hypothetical protein
MHDSGPSVQTDNGAVHKDGLSSRARPRPTPNGVSAASGAFVWDIWLVRALLLISAGFAFVSGARQNALGCAVALMVACVPLLGRRFAGMPVPRVLERMWVVGLGLIGVSVAFGLFDTVWHWGKLVHAAEAVCATAIAALVLLGYREHAQPGLPIHLAALASMCIGITFGAVWEFAEYLQDWLRYSDLQKSNADTMTDMLWNDLAAVVTTVLFFHVYHHVLKEPTQQRIGRFADALATPTGRFLDRHGKVAVVLILGGIVAYVVALWFAGRPIPGLPTG